jgi:hypothetical protein
MTDSERELYRRTIDDCRVVADGMTSDDVLKLSVEAVAELLGSRLTYGRRGAAASSPSAGCSRTPSRRTDGGGSLIPRDERPGVGRSLVSTDSRPPGGNKGGSLQGSATLRRTVMVSGHDEPLGDEERIARLVAEVEDLPFEEREAVIASLSDDDRSAVWDAQLNESEKDVPEDDEELGGEA